MPVTERRTITFIRTLIRSGTARLCAEGLFKTTYSGRTASLPRQLGENLVHQGVLSHENGVMTCRPETKNWLRRKLAAGTEDFAAQHRQIKIDAKGRTINLNESPLTRLALSTGKGASYLKPYHVEAGERIRTLVQRAQLRARVTMSYSPAQSAQSGSAAHSPHDISDMAVDARRELDRLHTLLPTDCAGVIFDVCGLEKGLQCIEAERGWPRRSAKLVLRIGLEHLAQHFGLTSVAVGAKTQKQNTWVSAGAYPTAVG